MHWSVPIFKIARHAPTLLPAMGLLVLAAFVVPTSAIAQEHGWSLRDLLFPRRQERIRPPADAFPPRPKIRKPRRVTPADATEPAKPTVEKAPDARIVLVVGDFMASGLADGLQATFADNPSIKIIDRSKGSSGFVRDDFFDWPKAIGPLIQQEKPAVVAVMIGSNDRQSLTIAGTNEPPRSEAWTKAYKARIAAFAKIIHDGNVPLLWVGMPSFKPGTMTSDMLAFNDLYRSAAEAADGEFVDIWDGFVDENGAFVFKGPDVNGQSVRLRGDDGINMTKAGKRKIAFYAEKPLLKLLGLSNASDTTTSPLPGDMLPAVPAIPMGPVDRTPPMRLDDPKLDGDTYLLGGAADPAVRPASAMEEALFDGIAGNAPPGRADNFSTSASSKPQLSKADATSAKPH